MIGKFVVFKLGGASLEAARTIHGLLATMAADRFDNGPSINTRSMKAELFDRLSREKSPLLSSLGFDRPVKQTVERAGLTPKLIVARPELEIMPSSSPQPGFVIRMPVGDDGSYFAPPGAERVPDLAARSMNAVIPPGNPTFSVPAEEIDLSAETKRIIDAAKKPKPPQ